METMETLVGTVERIVFESQDGGFSVFRLKVQSSSVLTAVTAKCSAPLIGESIALEGRWEEHARFGRQFKADFLKRLQPSDQAGIERFLASGAVKGIGAAMAKKLVDHFGDETLEVIEFHPQRLTQVDGIGKKKAEMMHAAYSVQSELRDLMLFLETHGISGIYAGKIFTRYGSASIDIIKKTPFRLADDVDGIGFKTADHMAAAFGCKKNDAARVEAGIHYTLSQCAAAGHCCIPEQVLIQQAAKLLQVDSIDTAAHIKSLLESERLCFEECGADLMLYPPQLYHAEKNVADRSIRLKLQAIEPNTEADEEDVLAWERSAEITLAPLQREAVKAALTYGIFVLTGGPGTGKTTVVKGMIDILEARKQQVLLGAPTGRAAKRLSEATGKKAVTVHRMLEANGSSRDLPQFSRDADEPLEADVIILDEVSMMDISLMNAFLNAVVKGGRVILVGDVDQLPAVGPGAVLKDILRSGIIPSIRLTDIYRQSEESMIVLNAHAIRRGQMPDCASSKDFEFRQIEESGAVAQQIVSLCHSELFKAGYDTLHDVQVLSPMHRLDCGVENLNRLLQEVMNPPRVDRAEIQFPSCIFRQGDKVMQTRNNYTKRVFNGDIGFIEELSGDKIKIRYTDELVEYEKGELNEIQLAYAMSVHKSQGSEYPVVVMPLTQGHYRMLQRNLLYTAVTRAKRKVILIGSKAALYTAVSADKTQKRFSLLAERLKNLDGDFTSC